MCDNNSKNSAHYTPQAVLTMFVFHATTTVFSCGENIVAYV